MDKPEIIALFRPGAKGESMVPLAQATLIVDWGIDGDRHAKAGSKRQVLVVDEAALVRFALAPGDMDENIIVRGVPVHELVPGQRIRIGQVLLEVTMPCPSCNKLEAVRPGLREALRGQRGMFTRVLHGGDVQPGDTVQVEGGVSEHVVVTN